MSGERQGLITVEVGGGAPGVTVLPRGTVVGDYALDGLLAQGGFGQVYRALHTPSCAARPTRSRASCARPR
jgi:hypothetical protein